MSASAPPIFDKCVNAAKQRYPNIETWVHQYYTPTRKWILTGFILVFSFLYASFQAWQDEHSTVIKAQKNEKDALKIAAERSPVGQQERISELERALGSANSKIDELEDENRPRQLNDDEKKTLIDALSPLSSASPIIEVVCVDPRDARYCQQWHEIFQKSNWKFSDNISLLFSPPIGITIQVGKETVIADSFFKALLTINLKPHGDLDPKLPENSFKLIIGVKE